MERINIVIKVERSSDIRQKKNIQKPEKVQSKGTRETFIIHYERSSENFTNSF